MRDSTSTLIVYGLTLLFAFFNVGFIFMTPIKILSLFSWIIVFTLFMIPTGISYLIHKIAKIPFSQIFCGMLGIIIFANGILYMYIHSPRSYDLPFANITLQLPNKIWTVTEKDNKATISHYGQRHSTAVLMITPLPNDFFEEYTYVEYIEFMLKVLAPHANLDYKIRGCGAVNFECTTYEYNLSLNGKMTKATYSFLKDDLNTVFIGTLSDPRSDGKNYDELFSIINSTTRMNEMDAKK